MQQRIIDKVNKLVEKTSLKKDEIVYIAQTLQKEYVKNGKIEFLKRIENLFVEKNRFYDLKRLQENGYEGLDIKLSQEKVFSFIEANRYIIDVFRGDKKYRYSDLDENTRKRYKEINEQSMRGYDINPQRLENENNRAIDYLLGLKGVDKKYIIESIVNNRYKDWFGLGGHIKSSDEENFKFYAKYVIDFDLYSEFGKLLENQEQLPTELRMKWKII